MLVLGCVIAFFNGLLLTHVLAVFRLAIKAGTFLVVDVGRRICPDLPLPPPVAGVIAVTGPWDAFTTGVAGAGVGEI
jgi:hypothetical protein